MATRGRKREAATSLPLTAALAFAETALHNARSGKFEHCFIGHGQLIATDGALTVGHPLESEITAYPHSGRLLTALKKCDGTIAMTLLDSQRLSIKSGKFRAAIECLEPGEFYAATPDAGIAAIDDRIKAGFEAIGHIAEDGAEKVHCASILLNPGSMVATNGALMAEYWHGNDLPPNVVLPKAAVSAVLKVGRKLQRFGYSGNSATFYFEDGSWIKSQLFSDAWPNWRPILDRECNPWPAPVGLFEAVRACAPFAGPTGALHFHSQAIGSHAALDQGASYEVAGLQGGQRFAAKLLLAIEHCAAKIDFTTYDDRAFFFGENVRGVLMGMNG